MRHDIIWLCDRVMRFQSKTHITPLLAIESPVAQWLEHPTRSRRVVGLNSIWNSDFFRVDVFTLKISLKFLFVNHENNIKRSLEQRKNLIMAECLY